MKRRHAPPRPSPDDKVGYCRPPKATQFKPGQSGNPKGRRKAEKGVGDLLQAALMTKVTIQENGVPRRITYQDVIIRKLVNDAARGDTRALRMLLPLMYRYAAANDPTVNPEHFRPEDQAIIKDYLSRQLGPLPSPEVPPDDGSGAASQIGEANSEPPKAT